MCMYYEYIYFTLWKIKALTSKDIAIAVLVGMFLSTLSRSNQACFQELQHKHRQVNKSTHMWMHIRVHAIIYI